RYKTVKAECSVQNKPRDYESKCSSRLLNLLIIYRNQSCVGVDAAIIPNIMARTASFGILCFLLMVQMTTVTICE
ncbi:hypothetical protein RRG08_048208, partial [Elysia crispata]